MFRRSTTIVPALAAAWGVTSAACAGGIVHVPADYPTIQIAINFADPGDTIEVSPGTYFEAIDLAGKAVTLRSTDGPGVTTIDALGQFQSAVVIANSEGADTVLEGFTITNGEAVNGGGVHVNGSSPTIVDCVVRENAAQFGGGVISLNGHPTLIACRFENNDASVAGGGLWLTDGTATITDCTFTNNTAGEAGAARFARTATVLTDCRFESNTADGDGGAVVVSENPAPVWNRCEFVGNTATAGRGGAIFARVCDPTVSNCVFRDHAAGANGGALAMYDGGTLTVSHCSFTTNHTDGGGAGGAIYTQGHATTNVTNSVAWWNTPNHVQVNGATSATYSNVQGGFAGTGNINADPLFANVETGDLHLQAGSPAIDAGNTAVITGPYPLDFDGNARAVDDPTMVDTGVALLGLSVDMGAHEFQPEGPVPTCLGDIDGDGVIGIGDLIAIITNWGVCP